VFLQKIKLENLLSFKDAELELRPLNVLIGPNASGKSNLIRAIGLLRSLPKDLATEIANGGGPRAWINKRARGKPSIQIAGALVPRVISFEYEFSFAEDGKSYRVAVDRLDAVVKSGASQKHVIGGFIPALNGILARTRQTSISDLMKQIGSPGGAPPPVLRAAMENVRLYREFHTGPDSNTRRGIAALGGHPKPAIGGHLKTGQ